MLITSCLLTLLIIPLTLMLFFGLKLLSFSRDFVFLIFYFQVYIYLHFSPVLSMRDLSAELQSSYLFLNVVIWFFFSFPLLILYVVLYPRFRVKHRLCRNIKVRLRRVSVCGFGVFVACYSLAFLAIAEKYGLFFRRIGHEGLAYRSSSMSFVELVVYRSFSETSVFLLSLGLFIFLNFSKGKYLYKYIFIGGFLLHALIYSGFVLINNRLQTAVLLTSLFIMFSYWKTLSPKWPLFSMPKIFALCLFLVFSAKLVVDLRDVYSTTGSISGYSITRIFSESESEKGSKLTRRLNGVDLMAKITEPAVREGFLWGEAWARPISIYYYMIFLPEKAKEIKLSLKTNPKVFMINKYLGGDSVDAPSSMLTDLYGNFFIFGFMILAILLVGIISFVSRQITFPSSRKLFVIALYLIPFLFSFEKEFITFIFNILKYSPVLFLMLLFPLFRFEYQEVSRMNDSRKAEC